MIAAKERTSMGAVVRRAIHTVLIRTQPGWAQKLADAEAERFLKGLEQKFPLAVLKGAKRSALKKKIVGALR